MRVFQKNQQETKRHRLQSSAETMCTHNIPEGSEASYACIYYTFKVRHLQHIMENYAFEQIWLAKKY